jgi:hypothetical protein
MKPILMIIVQIFVALTGILLEQVLGLNAAPANAGFWFIVGGVAAICSNETARRIE